MSPASNRQVERTDILAGYTGGAPLAVISLVLEEMHCGATEEMGKRFAMPTKWGVNGGMFSTLERLEARIAPAAVIAVAANGVVKIFADPQSDGTFEESDSFRPYGAGYTGAIDVAILNTNGLGSDELVTARSGKNGVKVFSLTSTGDVDLLIEKFTAFGGGSGVSVAGGDLDKNDRDELILGSGPGIAAKVKIYSDTDGDGKVGDNLQDTLKPFGGFKGGVRAAAGDFDNTGGGDLALGMWSAGGTIKTYFNADGDMLISDEPVAETAKPFGETYKGGFYLAAGHISSTGSLSAELAVGSAKGVSLIRIYNNVDVDQAIFDDPIWDSLAPATTGTPKGAVVAMNDTDGGGGHTQVEVIAASALAPNRSVSIWDDTTNDDDDILSNDPRDDVFSPFPNVKTRISLAGGRA